MDIRTKFGDNPDAIKHAAMLCLENENAKKVHKKILEDESNGDIFGTIPSRSNVNSARTFNGIFASISLIE